MPSFRMSDEDLLHYGVKGMKWGKRKDSSSRAPSSEDHMEVAALRRQETRTLSNKDLKKVNERLQLEANYARLNPGTTSKGKQFVEGTLAAAKLAANVYAIQTNPAVAAVLQLGKLAVTMNQNQGPQPSSAAVPVGKPKKAK